MVESPARYFFAAIFRSSLRLLPGNLCLSFLSSSADSFLKPDFSWNSMFCSVETMNRRSFSRPMFPQISRFERSHVRCSAHVLSVGQSGYRFRIVLKALYRSKYFVGSFFARFSSRGIFFARFDASYS